jgi:hypothetical protein
MSIVSAFVFATIGLSRISIASTAILLTVVLLIAVGIKRYRAGAVNSARLLIWIEFLYLIRFQLIAALFLALVLPACYFLVPSIFIGLFDARGFWSFVLVVWMAVQLAWTVMITSRLVLVYGPDRFSGIHDLTVPSPKPQEVGGRLKARAGDVTYVHMILYSLLAAPAVVLLFHGTEMLWYRKGIAIAIGVALALILLFVVAFLHYRIERWDAGWTAARVFPSFGVLQWRQQDGRWRLWRILDWCLSKLPERLRKGLVSDGRLRSGHQVAMMALLLELVVYVSLGFLLRPDYILPEHEPAALFFALFLIMLMTWFYTGAAFFLDAIRVPVLSTVLVLSILSGVTARTDHQFEISPAVKHEPIDVSPINVVRQWEKARQQVPNAPVIVVATAGGGIRAATWTTQVLTGLESESRKRACSVSLSSSLLAVSSVSGGSVGNMFFVAAYDSVSGNLNADPAVLEWIRFNSSRSTLSAVGWGLLYPDSARTLPGIGMLVPQTVDRGWALENAWIAGWRHPPNINNWREDVAAGRRPAAIFNATAAENGERFLIASTDLQELVLEDAFGKLEDKATIQFSRAFAQYDVPVATAARLSATFPYVSAEAQASRGATKARVHVGDGGYYDNSGVLSALEWLEEASAALKEHPVLLLLIDAEPGKPEAGKRWSWQRQILAPLDTLLKVRSSSQLMRSNFELGIGLRQLQTGSDPLQVKSVSFLFSSPTPTPLSWHLTSDQKQAITDNWQSNKSKDATQAVMNFLGCSK